ncbi:hypothetical protein RJ035_004995 [Blastomyces gilchristii]
MLTIHKQTVLIHPIIDEFYDDDPNHDRSAGFAVSKGLVSKAPGTTVSLDNTNTNDSTTTTTNNNNNNPPSISEPFTAADTPGLAPRVKKQGNNGGPGLDELEREIRRVQLRV